MSYYKIQFKCQDDEYVWTVAAHDKVEACMKAQIDLKGELSDVGPCIITGVDIAEHNQDQ